MKKKLFYLLLLSISVTTNAQTIFFDDFSNGLANFTAYDQDGLKPYSSSLFGGTAPYKAWIVYDETTTNKIALSTSYYSPAGASNDWLVTTSPISIASASTYLTWKAKAFDGTYADGYKVYISTTGNKVSDFTSNPVLTIAAENIAWTTRAVNLGNYIGQNIYVAFVNTSYDDSYLGIDDIFVGGTNFSVSDNTAQYIYKQKTAIKGDFKNSGSPVTSFTAKYTANGNTYTKEITGINLQSGENYSFTFSDSLNVPEIGVPVSYSIEVTTNSIVKTITGSVTRPAFKPLKKVAAEEATGTWCGWCPRGAVFLKQISEKYPETFIPIAVHNGDPMTYSVYDTGMRTFISGYPSGLIDRKYVIDPSDFENYYLSALEEFSPASITLSGAFVDASKKSIKVSTKTVFNTNYENAGFKIAFVLTENNVKGTASGYNQANYYAGGNYGEMGGFEKLANPVTAANMVYQDVARKIYDSFTGITGSVPATITLADTLRYEYTLDIPTSVNNLNEVSVIALLIDNNTGQIKNADKINVANLPVIAGIETSFVSDGISTIVKHNATELQINVKTNSTGRISTELYSLDGKQLYKSLVNNENSYNFVINSSGLKGIYIIKINTADGTVSNKIIL